jgi:glutathione S-transferase
MSDTLAFYGLDLSYFTGKVEAFLRYREIPFERIELSTGLFRMVAVKTGYAQMPAIKLADGRWMTDSTPMIAWLDQHMPGSSVYPKDPTTRFLSLLIEDYADEWLWRPALHYRWSFDPDKYLMSRRIAAEMMHDVPLPLFMRQALILRRQIRKYVIGDGITDANRAHVEGIYLRNLQFLRQVLRARPFLAGARPGIIDFGYFGSMFRHFGLDPTPSRIMRDTAPEVYEWLARLWNAKDSQLAEGTTVDEVLSADWDPVLADIGRCYAPYLTANAQAFGKGAKSFYLQIEGAPYQLPVHTYRVYCLERLQSAFRALDPDAQAKVRARLDAVGAFAPLFQIDAPDPGIDPRGIAPFYSPKA